MTTKRKIVLAVLIVVLLLVALDIYLGSAFPGFPFCNARGQCLSCVMPGLVPGIHAFKSK